ATDYLAKPFDPWVLRAKVGVFLDLHRKNRRLERLLARERTGQQAIEARLAALEAQLHADAPPDVLELRRQL
ncbi:response regulator, partial [Streptomyces sp. TRM76130]|nr:response regulator [Streptomyces sp. TRM76130]